MGKKMLEPGRGKKLKNANLRQLCTILDGLRDANYPGPYSITDPKDPRYDAKFITAERKAWELAREVLEPLGKITHYALRRPANLQRAYSRLATRFETRLGRYATGELIVDITPDKPNDPDSPIRLMATVSIPRAYGADDLQKVIAITLWKIVFQEEGYKKLRQCLYCSKWFVDNGRNQIAKFCGISCINKWWNRQNRRQAIQRKSLALRDNKQQSTA